MPSSAQEEGRPTTGFDAPPRQLRIAFIGTRGIPARYGGYETFLENLAPRLAVRGHRVTVYRRTAQVPETRVTLYKGVELVTLPTIHQKYLDTPVHTLLSALDSLRRSFDVILVCNAANAVFVPLMRLRGRPVAINVDGIERLRKKWNKWGRAWYRVGELVAARAPDAVVADALTIRDYYRDRYGIEAFMIPYGAEAERPGTTEVLTRLGLRPNQYVLYVSRLEPENNARLVIEAFRRVKTNLRLAVIGDAPYADAYKEELRAAARLDERVIMPGFVFGQGYRELQANAYAYVQATEVGGTHPALLEAMAFGNMVIANGTPENIEVLGDAGLTYRKNDLEHLISRLQWVVDNPHELARYKEAAARRIREHYSWDAIADAYERLFLQLVATSAR